MRDQRYVAAHRGGPLSLERHRLLAAWAADCAEHAWEHFADLPRDARPFEAISLARAWARGEISVGAAQQASVASHAAAREASTEAACCLARAAGHAVATAHMADHAPGAAIYAIKAIRAEYDPQTAAALVSEEHAWQKAKLPEAIRELLLSTFATKFANMKL